MKLDIQEIERYIHKVDRARGKKKQSTYVVKDTSKMRIIESC